MSQIFSEFYSVHMPLNVTSHIHNNLTEGGILILVTESPALSF